MFGRAIFWGLLLSTAALSADTIHLRGGGRVEGAVISQTRQAVRIRTSTGLRVIAKSKIRRITYDRPGSAESRRQAARRLREAARRAEEKRRALERQRAEEKRRAAAEREARERRRAQAEDQKAARRREERKTKIRRRRLTAEQIRSKSRVLPGYGQWEDGQRLRGALYGGAFFSFLFSAGAEAAAAYDTRSNYEATTERSFLVAVVAGPDLRLPLFWLARDDSAGLRADASAHRERAVGLGIVAAAVYFLQLWDVGDAVTVARSDSLPARLQWHIVRREEQQAAGTRRERYEIGVRYAF